MRKFLSCFFIFLFLVSLSIIAYAEKIIMNDGTEYEGNIHNQDNNVVFIVYKEDLLKLNKSDIKEIIDNTETKKKSGFSIIDDTEVVTVQNEFILQIGYDFYGKYSHKGHESETDNSKGIVIGAKYYHFLENIFGVGCGINFQNSRDLEDIPGRFYFIPAYLSLKIRSNPTQIYKYGYIVGNIGYNLFLPDSEYSKYIDSEKGGLYYSIGIGIVYSNIVLELLGSVHSGDAKLKSRNYDFDIEYRTYTFSIGYIF